MLNFGYNEEDYNRIINFYPLNGLTDDKKFSNIKSINNYLLNFGFTKEDIIYMVNIYPTMYTYSIQKYENKIK